MGNGVGLFFRTKKQFCSFWQSNVKIVKILTFEPYLNPFLTFGGRFLGMIFFSKKNNFGQLKSEKTPTYPHDI